GAVPTTPVTGDLWLTTGDNHLQFQSAAGLKSLAFTTDIAAGTVTGTGLTAGQLIVGNGGSAIGVGNLSGDVSTSGGTITTLASVGAAGTFTKVSTDVKGRVTAGTTASAATYQTALRDRVQSCWLLRRRWVVRRRRRRLRRGQIRYRLPRRRLCSRRLALPSRQSRLSKTRAPALCRTRLAPG